MVGNMVKFTHDTHGFTDQQYETVKSNYAGIGPHAYSDIREAADTPRTYEVCTILVFSNS